jgi:phosphoribosylglycinamide formyltransferase-1
MKIGFYVSRAATRLKKFLKNIEIHHPTLIKSIDFIVTDNLEDNELESICLRLNINFIYLNLENINARNLYSSNYICSLMVDRKTDYLFIYCDSIIKGEILEKFENRIINFHPSLLPAHKGLMAIDQALNNSTFLLGNTAHFIDEGIDTGPVIIQSIFSSVDFENYDQVLDLQVPMLIQLFYWFINNRIFVKNGKVFVSGANYKIDTFVPNIEFDFNNK